MVKNWIGKEYYIEYLNLKERITETTKKLSYCSGFDKLSIEELHEELETMVKQFRILMNQLKLEGVNLEDLILLGLGVEIDLF